MVPELDPCIEQGASAGRALAVVVARDEEPALGRVLAGLPREACGMPVDVLLVDDGSRDSTPAIGREHGARVVSHQSSQGLGAALRTGLELARDEGYAAAVYLDGDGEYDPADFATVLEPGGARTGRLRDRLALPRRARRDELAPHARQPR